MEQKIHTTKDYTLFLPLPGNRKIDQGHVKRIALSMKDKDLCIPIIVNEDMRVIDGQHRLEARRQLRKTVYYIVLSGMGIHETQLANATNKNWTMDDYLNSYVDQNFAHYKTYKEFREKWKFGHSECISLLSHNNTRNPNHYHDFKHGQFGVKNLSRANDYAEKIVFLEQYYKGCRRRSFVLAMCIALNHEAFIYEEFLDKLAYQSSRMVDCTDTKQYLKLIEEIYNFKRALKSRIHFNI